MTLATVAGSVTVAKSDVAVIEPQNFSMMPEGLVLAFKEGELRDLVAYLRGTSQVPLPKEEAAGPMFLVGGTISKPHAAPRALST